MDILGLNTPGTANEAATKGYVDGLSGGGGVGLPIGAIVPYTGSSAPANTLLCDGSAVSRTTYATLFSIISTAYGAGNGTTTFNVPDFRTNTRIPIGVDSGQAGITALGNSGGSFNHTHTSTAHAHSFSHSHDLGNHTHTYDHFHTMASHTHDQQNHNHAYTHAHNFPAHGHGTGGISYSGGGHQHSIAERTGSGVGNLNPRPSDGTGTLNQFATSNNSQGLSISGSIGLGGGSNGDGAFGMNNNNPANTGPSNNGTSGPSTNNTSTATGSTGTPSNNNTDTFGGNTDSGGGSITTSSNNPPFVTVNFIIQAL